MSRPRTMLVLRSPDWLCVVSLSLYVVKTKLILSLAMLCALLSSVVHAQTWRKIGVLGEPIVCVRFWTDYGHPEWGLVGTTKALLLRESRDWLTYDVPEAMQPAHWKGRWCGQAQKWFALGFTGHDSDIDLAAHHQEFDAWRWAPARELSELIVPWKRPVYDAVLKEFADLVG